MGFSTPNSIKDLPKTSASLLNTSGNLTILTKKTNYIKGVYDIQSDGVLHLNLAYFPAWKTYVNGKDEVAIKTPKGINVSLLKGKGIFEAKFVSTGVETIGNILTVLAFVAVLFGTILKSYRKYGR
jgi:uncharacterized membrane protein YfhO